MAESLPSILPVFRVQSTVLMPNVHLPISMSESDYFAICSEIVENNIVGVIQPKPMAKNRQHQDIYKSFKIGCAGKITDIKIDDGEVHINIIGICRFEVIEDIAHDRYGIERVKVSYDKYKLSDIEQDVENQHAKEKLICVLDRYFKRLDIVPNWKEIEQTPLNVLVSALAMACPLHPSEKQALLETVGIDERSAMITKLIKMNSFDKYNTSKTIN